MNVVDQPSMGRQDYGSTLTAEEQLMNPSPVSMDSSSWDSVNNSALSKPLHPGDCIPGSNSSNDPGLLKSSSKSEMVQLLHNPSTNLAKTGSKNTSFDEFSYRYCPFIRSARLVWVILCIAIVVLTCVMTSSVLSSSWIHWENTDDENSNNHHVPSKTKNNHENYDDDSVQTTFDPHSRIPFSKLDPVLDLKLYNYIRPLSSSPPNTLTDGFNSAFNNTDSNKKSTTYPTNAWYQNLLLLHNEEEPAWNHRAYSIPYIIDPAGPIPGLRVHVSQTGASSNVVQMNVVQEYALTLGASMDATRTVPVNNPSMTNEKPSNRYTIEQTNQLGFTMKWDEYPMTSTVSKGMPYATMIYEAIQQKAAGNANTTDSSNVTFYPTIAAEISLAKNPIIDGTQELLCQVGGNMEPILVQQEIELFFEKSDFTWFVFVSEPVLVQCVDDVAAVGTGPVFQLQFVDWANEPDSSRELIIRVALSKLCTSGRDPIYCHQEKMHPTALFLGQGNYDMQLRTHAHLIPGANSKFDFEYIDERTAILQFDWDVQNVRDFALHPIAESDVNHTLSTELITYALPHHFDMIVEAPPGDVNIYCVNVLVGPACLYEGSNWNLIQDIPEISFTASRPPAAWSIQDIANSLKLDLDFKLPTYLEKGIGDTYFSGKMLAKLGRIVLIADELIQLCRSTPPTEEYVEACKNVTLPDTADVLNAVNRLKASVEIWINGSAVVPLVYDPVWGGVVSCGCVFDSSNDTCRNIFPDCTAFDDPGLNFGNAFYNDMHFHYGYHIYAAAVVAKFDPEWGRQMWQQVLLLVRSIANPSNEDKFFPTWRHKDWYQGHSWASGIAAIFPNGKNQESSSEAIAAYEAVALYGKVMTVAWKDYSVEKAKVAKEITKVGQIMTASEVRAAQFYWHVKTETKIKIYPSVYTQHAIGMLWQTMAQFQTWFGARPFLASGIQLLPLTPIAEFRDSLTWSKQLYGDYAASCEADTTCEAYGWSVLQLALLAKVGHPRDAVRRALALNITVFDTPGGNGHSLTNTIWFLSSRREVEDPLPLTKEEKEKALGEMAKDVKPKKKKNHVSEYCGQPDHCSNYVLDTIAGLYSCRQRMDWLIQEKMYTEEQACYKIAVEENPIECGACNPESGPNRTVMLPTCSPCTIEECSSHLNRCPMYPKTYVCTEGPSSGGCSDFPWDVPSAQCTSCCDVTDCQQPSPAEVRAGLEANCPPCAREICRGSINNCHKDIGAQYLCISGPSRTGCSMLPWAIDPGQCAKCCTLLPGCEL